MLYYVLISIVILAEIVIASELLIHLWKLNKELTQKNILLKEINLKISDIMHLTNKISVQLTELAPIWVNNVKNFALKIVLNQVKSTLMGVVIFLIKQNLKKKI